MAETTLRAEPRAGRGSPDARRLRAAGRVPAVVYGHGAEPLPISVEAREMRHALSGAAGANTLFDLRVGRSRHLVITRELQEHPVRHTLAHIDFQVVRRDEVVSAEVPLQLVGEALAVTRAGGTVDHTLLSIGVRARPADIPNSVEIDVSGLELGHSLHVRDLPALRNVTYDADPDTVVVVAQAPRGTAEGEAEAAEAPAEDGGEAAAR